MHQMLRLDLMVKTRQTIINPSERTIKWHVMFLNV